MDAQYFANMTNEDYIDWLIVAREFTQEEAELMAGWCFPA